jgi:hypothetical protein
MSKDPRDWLIYDPVEGTIVWKVRRAPNVKAGDRAGTKTDRGRISIFFDKQYYSVASMAVYLVTGERSTTQINYLDGNHNNCEWDNMELTDIPLKRADNKVPKPAGMKLMTQKWV